MDSAFINYFNLIYTFLGFYGPYILFVSSIFLLYNKNILLGYYLFGFLFNILINIFLKNIIQQPRPDLPNKSNIIETNPINKIINSLKVNQGKRPSYGMPSQHMQMSIYSVAFIFFALRSHKYILFIMMPYFFISIVTAFQRVSSYDHSPLQVVVGSIVGAIFGYGLYNMTISRLHGKILPKIGEDVHFLHF
jgi:membrane-associated phospholipid phosphatase